MTPTPVTVTLFWCPRTRSSRIIWLLEELQIPYRLKHIDIRDPEARKHPGFRKASPMGKVPAMSLGEVSLADSSAIALYLADRFPEAGLAPEVTHANRGRYLYWSTYTPGVIEPAMAEKFGNWTVSRVSSGWGDFDLMVETLEEGLKVGPWILGDHFSAADTLLGSSVHFMQLFGILPESKTLTDYLERCKARPAYQRSEAIEAKHTETDL